MPPYVAAVGKQTAKYAAQAASNERAGRAKERPRPAAKKGAQ